MGSNYNHYKMFKYFNRKFKISEKQPPPDVTAAFRRYAEGAEDHMTADQLLKFLVDYQGEVGRTAADAAAIMQNALHHRHHSDRRHGLSLEDFFDFLFQDDLNGPINSQRETAAAGCDGGVPAVRGGGGGPHDGGSATQVLGGLPGGGRPAPPPTRRAIMQNALHHRHHSDRRHGLSLEDFFDFLFQDDLNGPINSQVHHDMTAPLQHYFIYTGHNSYLTGNQLSSDCSEIPIIRALENGVRGIELDLWPNSGKDDVHVLHGRTLTTPVPLVKCLKSIKEHAFVKSPYPVIITLEDHLTPKLQAKVAGMVIQVFGDMLYCPESEEGLQEFPSPEALKHKIILSTKPPKEYLSTTESKKNVETQEKDSSEDENDDKDEEESDAFQQKSGNLVAPEYKHLIAIRAGHAKKGLRHALRSGTDKVNRLSLSEQRFEKAASSYATDVVRFTQKNILRVYPKGTRVTSSNYRPTIGWMHGAQMVAFNMQGYGKSLWMMHGLFRANGGCGFVKKPDLLMHRDPNDDVFHPKLSLPVKKTLKVNVYMGDGWRLDFSRTHFDAYSPPDFYTKIYIVGVPCDEAKKRTRIIEDDWVPYWDEEFAFPLTVPELALLRIEVREYDRSEKDDFGGQTCLPVSELKPGIRAVPLYDKKGHKYKSVRLLMGFQFE
ncbi:phosphoinositide phospholipase c 6 [Phtheirospermum japonicum]|uniref:Phosphoinositide phospholipase C n=1 Tax=Phtheirospermum japonicum TaxID=374723 RepID=A0A830CP26_9LAMI|nr:phosphoinositide phospholipase c 6 [Phtheirospermum japonicum]